MKGAHNNFAWNRVLRVELWTEQGCRCFYCTRFLKRDEVTLDHKVPRKNNGSDDRSNLAASCEFCNKAKGSMGIDQFWKLIKSRTAKGFPFDLIRAVRSINKQADKACAGIVRYAR